MPALTGVSSHFCAAHRDRFGILHGHTWEVLAWFPAGEDALALKKRLEAVLADYDHTELPEDLSTAEAIADEISGDLPSVVEIEIRRPFERIYTRWTA
jgi:6-pyruvoyl-tetrahydropterin synthase